MVALRAPARWLAAPATAAVFVLGVWVAGGVITNDFKGAMALTVAWGSLAGLASLVVARRARRYAAPVLGGFLVSAVAVGGYLAWTTLRDRVVHERLVAGTELAAGRLESLEHASRGRAAVVATANGSRYLQLSRFSTSPGPDLRVRLVPGDTDDGGAAGNRDLGALKGNKGDQQYALPADVDVTRRTWTAIVWCRAFSAGFAKAILVHS